MAQKAKTTRLFVWISRIQAENYTSIRQVDDNKCTIFCYTVRKDARRMKREIQKVKTAQGRGKSKQESGLTLIKQGRKWINNEGAAILPLPRLDIKLIFCAFENRVSQKAHPSCRMLTAFGKRVNFLPFIMCVPLKRQKRGRNRRFVGRFLPQIAEICFNCLKQIPRA